MLLKQATVRNVSRAMREINAFESEGDFKPHARQALKQILEKRLEEEMAEYLGLLATSMPQIGTTTATVTMSDTS